MPIPRLYQVADDAALQSLRSCDGRASGGNHNHTCVRTIGSHPLQEFKAINVRHLLVAYHQVILFSPEETDRLSTVCDPLNGITIFAEEVDPVAVEILLIFNYENTPLISHNCYHQT